MTCNRTDREVALYQFQLTKFLVAGLSAEAKFPACRDDYLSVYTALIEDYQIPPQKISFCGDSAGGLLFHSIISKRIYLLTGLSGGLVAISALQIKRLKYPKPSSLILISPWLDLTMNETLHSPAMTTDFLITFKDANPGIVNALLPPGMKPEDPRVSPLFDDLSSLPPQLVFAGTAEVLWPDSVSWVKTSLEAGNKVKFIRGEGEMHT